MTRVPLFRSAFVLAVSVGLTLIMVQQVATVPVGSAAAPVGIA